MVLQVLRGLFTLAKESKPEAKVVVAAAGSFHSGFSLCKHILPFTTPDKGWWTGPLFEWMPDWHAVFSEHGRWLTTYEKQQETLGQQCQQKSFFKVLEIAS